MVRRRSGKSTYTIRRRRSLEGLAGFASQVRSSLPLSRLPGVRAIFFVLVAGTTAYLVISPLVYLTWGTLYDEGGFTLRFFIEAFTILYIGEVLKNTAVFATGAALVAIGLGTSLAYLVARTDLPFKRTIRIAALLPLIIPGVLHTIAWIFLASPRIGLYNRLIERLFGRGDLLNIFSLGGMIFVEGLHISPVVFLLMLAAFQSMNPSLEEAALITGAGRVAMLRRVTLPLMKPAVYSAALLMLAMGLEAFEVPLLLGLPSDNYVMTTMIWQALGDYPPRFGQAGAYSLALIILVGLGTLMYSRLSKQGRRFQVITGKGFRPRRSALGLMRVPILGLTLLYIFGAVIMPLLILVYVSLLPYYADPTAVTLADLSLKNYQAVLTQDVTVRAFRNSLVLALTAATCVMLLMAVASWCVTRTQIRGRWLLDTMSMVPLAIPSLVLGVALLFIYLRAPVPIYGTLWILFIAYLTRYLPHGMRYASGTMHQIGTGLEEAAYSAGASWVQTFRRITLPLLLPGLVGGWIYIVTVSVRELGASILLYSPGNEVLSVLIWEEWSNGSLGQVAALGILMTVLILAITTAGGVLSGTRVRGGSS